MKKLLVFLVFTTAAFIPQCFAQNSTNLQTSPLLTDYYQLKDALVKSNSNETMLNAAAFLKTMNEIDKERLNDENRDKLSVDVAVISKTNDLKLQREKFAALSINMFELAKTVKLSAEPVYQQYCPMKKAYW